MSAITPENVIIRAIHEAFIKYPEADGAKPTFGSTKTSFQFRLYKGGKIDLVGGVSNRLPRCSTVIVPMDSNVRLTHSTKSKNAPL